MQAVTIRGGAVVALSFLATAVAVSPARADYVSGRQTPINQTTGKMSGDLIGTWKIVKFKIARQKPVFYATGTELFTGCIDQNHDRACTADDLSGTLNFSFRYWARSKGKRTLLGTCSHRVTGAGGGLTGTTGFIQMVDVPNRAGKVVTEYEGFLSLPGAPAKARTAKARAC